MQLSVGVMTMVFRSN